MQGVTNDMSALEVADKALDDNTEMAPKNLADFPPEILLQIIKECLLLPARKIEPELGPFGHHLRHEYKFLLGGAVRDLTLVNRRFRSFTAPYLFKSICIDDAAECVRQDKLRQTYKALVGLPTWEWLRHMEKFTISLGRTPNQHFPDAGQKFIEMLNYMQSPETMRYVLETSEATYTVLNDVKNVLLKFRRCGFDFFVFRVRQLELSCVWGGHGWDFQFMTWPYLNTERLWLDYNTAELRPECLNLEKLRNLEYVMHRAQPMNFFLSGTEVEQFEGLTAPDGRRPPKLRQLCHTMKQVKHLALCGVLTGPVTEIAPLIRDMRSLEQLDITDQQAVTDDDIYNLREEMLHPTSHIDWAMKHSRLLREHRHNVDRIEAATVFFTTIPSLQRICFVRDQIGTFYHAVRDAETGALERVEEGGTVKEQYRYLQYGSAAAAWRCGFPNRLGYNLWDRARPGGSSWCTTERAFWLNPAYLAGDESVVPDDLRFDVALRREYGVMPPEAAERLAEFDAKFEKRWRRREEERRRDRYIRNQQRARDRAQKAKAEKGKMVQAPLNGAQGRNQSQALETGGA